MTERLWLRPPCHSGATTTLVLMLAGASLVVTAHAQQARQPGMEQRQTIQQAFRDFAGCVRSKTAQCIARLASKSGVSLGVDAPLISRRAFERELTTGKSLRCRVWGAGCSHQALAVCALSRVLNGSTLSVDYTRPALYNGDWQVETTVRDPSRQCKQEFAVIWKLEEGFWRIAAFPYV